MLGAVIEGGLQRPFMLVASQVHGRDDDPSWERFWSNLGGWRLDLRLRDAGHESFSDLQMVVPQLALPPEFVQELIGSIDPDRSVANQRAYVAAFFDQLSRGTRVLVGRFGEACERADGLRRQRGQGSHRERHLIGLEAPLETSAAPAPRALCVEG